MQDLETKEIGESSDMFHYYSILNPDAYNRFINSKREIILSWVKKKTNTLTIYEEGKDIHIHYLFDNDADKTIKSSMYRINIVHAFFPNYEHYYTKLIILPFPDLETCKVVIQDSTKCIPPSSLGEEFSIHLNQIWYKSILYEYGANSQYEWQKQYYELRKISVLFYKECTRLLENILENKQSRNIYQKVEDIKNDFITKELSLHSYPSSNKKYFEKKPYPNELRAIREWLSSLNNFIRQLTWLLSPQGEQNRNLPLINLQSARHRLSFMQDSYDNIAESSYQYFQTEQLKTEEHKWLTRLLHTVQFFISNIQGKYTSTIVVASRSVSEWKQQEDEWQISQLTSIIVKAKEATGFTFYPPSRITQDETLKYAAIGIAGCDFGVEDDLWRLSVNLRQLAFTDIHFFTLILVDENREAFGGIRFSRVYFERLNTFFETNEMPEGNPANPLPCLPNTTLLETLPGITLKKAIPVEGKEIFYRMMMNIWKAAQGHTG